jgi:hypothetical protein
VVVLEGFGNVDLLSSEALFDVANGMITKRKKAREEKRPVKARNLSVSPGR